DIHDGAQQHLVALSIKLQLARSLGAKDPEKAGELLEELQADTREALQAVRDLARGIHPPVLTDRGLVAALDAHARRCPLPVKVRGSEIGRYATNVEAAVYFCCLEAIQNGVKHSDASVVTVHLREEDGALRFSVGDDGIGFDRSSVDWSGLTNMGDRLAAVGGRVEISSSPGRGTIVTGWVPLG
ncbi:MAG: sensor histidine kinase, partial [Actinomycetota bacterium]|nr:sensor histidine kinase [Actinomycetota bacterium]